MKLTFNISRSPVCSDQNFITLRRSLLGLIPIPFSFFWGIILNSGIRFCDSIWIYILLKEHQSCRHKTVLLLWYRFFFTTSANSVLLHTIFFIVYVGMLMLENCLIVMGWEKYVFLKGFEVSRWKIMLSFKALVRNDTKLFNVCISFNVFRTQPFWKKLAPPALWLITTPKTRENIGGYSLNIISYLEPKDNYEFNEACTSLLKSNVCFSAGTPFYFALILQQSYSTKSLWQ